MKHLIVITLALFSTVLTYSQEKEVHPIETKCLACIDGNPSTHDVIKCLTTAYIEWDAEMNKYYKLIRENLDDEGKAAFKAAQLKWIAFRDDEINFNETFYSSFQGTMFQVFLANRSAEIIKTRALELISYYDIIKMEK